MPTPKSTLQLATKGPAARAAKRNAKRLRIRLAEMVQMDIAAEGVDGRDGDLQEKFRVKGAQIEEALTDFVASMVAFGPQIVAQTSPGLQAKMRDELAFAARNRDGETLLILADTYA